MFHYSTAVFTALFFCRFFLRIKITASTQFQYPTIPFLLGHPQPFFFDALHPDNKRTLTNINRKPNRVERCINKLTNCFGIIGYSVKR